MSSRTKLLGMPPGRVSGPRRSRAPQMTAPAAKMPAHHENTDGHHAEDEADAGTGNHERPEQR